MAKKHPSPPIKDQERDRRRHVNKPQKEEKKKVTTK